MFLQGMGGASMGIWCAHGEGRAHFPDPQVKQTVLEGGLAPIRLIPAHIFSLLLLLLMSIIMKRSMLLYA